MAIADREPGREICYLHVAVRRGFHLAEQGHVATVEGVTFAWAVGRWVSSSAGASRPALTAAGLVLTTQVESRPAAAADVIGKRLCPIVRQPPSRQQLVKPALTAAVIINDISP
jgi:hypothetical protein